MNGSKDFDEEEIIAVALEWPLFSVVPTPLTLLGVAVTCAGVALVAWRPRSCE